MNFLKKEDEINLEIEKLNQNIKEVEDLLTEDKKELDDLLDKLILEQVRLENELKTSNAELRNKVSTFYDKKRINDEITKILNYTLDEFESKYKSIVNPFRKIDQGKFVPLNINLSLLKNESFTEIIKKSSWQHESKKILFLEWGKIILNVIGGFSIFVLVVLADLDNFFLIFIPFFWALITLNYVFFTYININYFGSGSMNYFYENFFEKNVETVYVEEIMYLDSICGLDEEIKKLV